MVTPSRHRIALIFGGTSAEHAISLRSARAVLEHIDQERFEVCLCGIDQHGGWQDEQASQAMLEGKPPATPGSLPVLPDNISCAFPVIHGPGGEDGSLQGWFALCGIPCVGSGILGSSIAMDKSICKRILRDAGIEVVSWSEIRRADFLTDPRGVVAALIEKRGLPCFVKPAAQGSSIGITRATSAEELREGLDGAFEHGEWVVVEPALNARELEVAVLGGEQLTISVPGEIAAEDWYDYASKYENDSAELMVPATGLQPLMIEGIKDISRRAFEVLRLHGMARIDFFLGKKTGRLAVNEVNTIPGFTSISMYPLLMEHSGVSFSELCTRLIEEAMRVRFADLASGNPLHSAAVIARPFSGKTLSRQTS